MSTIYTFEELKRRFPSVEAIAVARNRVAELLDNRELVVIYGSSVWGLRPEISDQHHRRSDVDVAIASRDDGLDQQVRVPSACSIEERLKHVTEETGVPIEVVQVGWTGSTLERPAPYNALINPSTRDHFKLLAANFPNACYKEFIEHMAVAKMDRIEDLRHYLNSVRGGLELLIKQRYGWGEQRRLWRDGIDVTDARIRSSLCKLENFPDHFMRKVLGKDGLLPCPDSKQNVRATFAQIQYEWPEKDEIMPFFKHIWTFSKQYEALIDEVRAGLSEPEYERRLGKLTYDLVDVANRTFQYMGLFDAYQQKLTYLERVLPVAPEKSPL